MYKFTETEAYIGAVCDYIKESFGSIKDSWRPLLNMLGTQYDLFLLSKKSIEDNGIIITTSRGMIANPAIKIQNDAIIQINKLVQELALSPKAAIKLRIGEKEENEDDFLETLTH